MPIKYLPTHVTKAKACKMYKEIPESTLRADMREIIEKNRQPKTEEERQQLKKCHNLQHFEWLCLLRIYKIPIGYSNLFTDEELFQDKLDRYPETKNFI